MTRATSTDAGLGPDGDAAGTAGAGAAPSVPTDLADPETERTVERFLYAEAMLLDERRFSEWLELFTDDATYEVPLRLTRESQVPSDLSDRGRIFWDSKNTLAIRVQRLQSEFAWAEQPPSRTRHMISNLIVGVSPDGQLGARYNVLVFVNRGDDAGHHLYAAGRRDLLVREGGSLRIRHRWMAVDAANLPGNSLSVFL
ncbi:MAG: aromatic-ring-hydroxylating dioxygenase subunit beta [Acidimicrobiales bacterium]